MKKSFGFAVAAFVFLCGSAVFAEQVNLSALVGDTVQVTISPYASGENDGSFYVGLTEVQVTYNGTKYDPFQAFCNDFSNEIPSLPTSYNATVVSLLASSFTGDSLGVSLADLQQQATIGAAFGTTPSGNSAADSVTQHAIWNYTGGSYADGDLDDAAAAVSFVTGNYAGAYLLSPNGEPGEQGFMTLDSGGGSNSNLTSTPEPATGVLLGGALLFFLIATIVWRRVGRRNRQT